MTIFEFMHKSPILSFIIVYMVLNTIWRIYEITVTRKPSSDSIIECTDFEAIPNDDDDPRYKR